jgi:hypothetical protein
VKKRTATLEPWRPAGLKILTSKVCVLVLARILYGMLGEENMDACISK